VCYNKANNFDGIICSSHHHHHVLLLLLAVQVISLYCSIELMLGFSAAVERIFY
jgi:hypothetical protein